MQAEYANLPILPDYLSEFIADIGSQVADQWPEENITHIRVEKARVTDLQPAEGGL